METTTTIEEVVPSQTFSVIHVEAEDQVETPLTSKV